jgi:tetratricopeptide (TPR) repeat protein
MAGALFKDAKTPADYQQVVNHIKQAVDLAPEWPEARYNLAMAREASGDYAGAIVDLRIYLQFKLSGEDARAATDRIYTLEAKAEQAGQKVPPAQTNSAVTAAPAAPANESYRCATPQNLKTAYQNFVFDFSTHTASEAIQYENATQRLKNLKFEESGQQLILRDGCQWSAKPLGCATVNRKALTLSIYAWGKNGGEDGPSGDHSGGNNVVVYECNLVKQQ